MAVMKAHDMAPVACAAMVASALYRSRQCLFVARNVRRYVDGGQLGHSTQHDSRPLVDIFARIGY